MLDIVQSFPFIILLYCESYECIYISPICDVGTSYIIFSVEIRRLGILYFSLFTWYQSHERKPNFWVIVFHSDLLLRRRISFSPQQQPPPTAAVSASGDFSGSSFPAENHRFRGARRRSTGRWQPRRKAEAHAPSRAAFLWQRTVHAPARECACGRVLSSPVTGLHTQGRPAPSWCSTPPAVQPEPSSSTFWPFFCLRRRLQFISDAFCSSPAPSVPPQSSSVHLQSYSLRFESPFSSSSSSTAVIRPLIRALFNPNVVQSPVK